MGHFLEIGLGERLDIARFDSILTSEIHSTSISEATKLKNFPGGLTAPPRPPAVWIFAEIKVIDGDF